MAPPLVTHTGGCHCGAVRFQVRAPARLTAWDCNCTVCAMKRNTHFVVPAEAFTLLSGEAQLTEYRWGTGVARHRFCASCGVQAFYHPRSNPDGVAVTIHCIDAGTVEAVTVCSFDGLNWEAAFAASGIAAHSVAPAPAAAQISEEAAAS